MEDLGDPLDITGARLGRRSTDGARQASDARPLSYGANFEDNNSDKMVGLRVRAVSAGSPAGVRIPRGL